MRRTLPVIVGVIGLVAAACGAGDDPALQAPTQEPSPQEDGGAQQVPGDALRAELEEFSITMSEDSAPAGEVTFAAENTGQIDHDFLVIDTDLAPDELPQSEGEVDEEAEDLEVVDEIDTVSPGGTEVLSAELEAGEYVLICNIVGHYDSGMHTSLTVE